MSTLTSILSTDLISTGPSVLTGNFQNINQDKLESNQSSVLAYGIITGAASGANKVTSSVLVGTVNQVLTSNGAGVFPSFQTVTQVVPSILTIIPYPVNFIDPGATTPAASFELTNPSTMALGKVMIPYKIQASVFLIMVPGITVSDPLDFTIYAEDGQSQVLSITTASVQTGLNPTYLSSVISINPGIYYVGVNTNAANGQFTVPMFQTEAPSGANWTMLLNPTSSVTGSAIVEGTLPIGAGTPPTTFQPSAISATNNKTMAFRIN